ncbi:MAG: tRNA1(Val) (adenine(37)-N6)-methyltransferase [Thermotogota bacterium]
MYFNKSSEDFATFQVFLKNNPLTTFSLHDSNKVNHASVLLLWLSKPPNRVKNFIEIGCGSGFVSFGLAKYYDLHGTGIDIQSGLKESFEKGAQLNKVANQVEFIGLDIIEARQRFKPEMYDMCVFNPPHYISGRGETARDKIRQLSRASGETLFEQYSDSVSFLLKTKGLFSCVIAPNNMEEWMQAFIQHRLFVKSITPVYSNPNIDARLLLVRGIKNSKSSFVKIKPAVFLM